MGTKQYYPKDLFTRAEVLKAKRSFRFDKLWKLKQTKKDWILEFTPPKKGLKRVKIGKNYVLKRR